MRAVFSRTHPSFQRVLVVESGPRSVAETFLQHLYAIQKSSQVDLLTCYSGAPTSFDPLKGTVYSVHEPAIKGNRGSFLRQLIASPYTAVAILCTGDKVLTKWKWLIAMRARTKVVLVNEHAGFFYLDLQHRHFARMMLLTRAGMHRPPQLSLFGELLLMPFTVIYLSLYALFVHARRAIRSR